MNSFTNARKLRLESLEERTLLAVVAGGIETGAEIVVPTEAVTWVVNTLEDPASWDTSDDVISLREAIASALTGDTIVFDSSIAGATITLNGSQLEISKGITIDASSIGGITIDAAGQSVVFYIHCRNTEKPVELISLTISGGYDVNFGGGIYNYGALTMTNCIVSENTGCGIDNVSGTLTMMNCTVSGNTSSSYGGGICNGLGSTLTMTNCTVSRNTSSFGGGGGGIFNSGTLTMTNCTIFGNAASYDSSYGGGIYNQSGRVSLTNCTISGNYAKERGAGVYCYSGVEIRNSIVALNYSRGEPDISGPYAYCYACIIGSDPGFVTPPLFNEKGELLNYDEIDLSLASTSRAIDLGDNNYVETKTDIKGNLRICAAWKETATVDIGAYEYQEKTAVKPSWVVTTVADTIDDTDGQISLREAIQNAEDGATIIFDETLVGKTITLNNNELHIDKNITIDATAIGGITIDANGKSRVFLLTPEYYYFNIVDLIGLKITGGNADNGGGIYVDHSVTLMLTNCSVYGNIAEYGAGVYLSDGGLVLTNSFISANHANIDGGGVFSYGRVSLTNSTLSDNSANIEGGGFYGYDGIVTMTNCTVSGNTAGENGGGIIKTGILTLTNCSVFGNTASFGGGIYYDGGAGYYYDNPKTILKIIGTTVTGNSAQDGSGIYIVPYGSQTNYDEKLTVANSIISLNNGNDEMDIYPTNEFFADRHNIIAQDPGFIVAPIFDESGKLTNFDELNLSLSPESLAIDTGDNSYVATETDLARNLRIINGIVDIGAYEYQGTGPEQLATPTITTGNSGIYVSYGANRHQITWDAIENAVGYELTYTSDNRDGWTSVITTETSAVIAGLTCGDEVAYRVRALGEGSYADSEWSEGKTFVVCPMDINGDGDIGGGDRGVLVYSWLAEEGDDGYIPAADIDGNGDVGGTDRTFLANNWLNEVGVDDMIYPHPLAADTVFAAYESGDLDVNFDVF